MTKSDQTWPNKTARGQFHGGEQMGVGIDTCFTRADRYRSVTVSEKGLVTFGLGKLLVSGIFPSLVRKMFGMSYWFSHIWSHWLGALICIDHLHLIRWVIY